MTDIVSLSIDWDLVEIAKSFLETPLSPNTDITIGMFLAVIFVIFLLSKLLGD